MSVFTHVTLGTKDLDRATAFYDEILPPLGLKRLINVPGKASAWGIDQPALVVLYPIDGEEASSGNGATIGLQAPTPQAVDEVHRLSLKAGATDEGAPGPRPVAKDAYAAYIRDLDGHKICIGYRPTE
jgi:catechol 2,3-dioxygenase-like lactoylglutathione lyase family enzyme|tara:strand:+ start:2008 stop:2391 length:384 start_codon:yes stop_codon:yes gene_type:complete